MESFAWKGEGKANGKPFSGNELDRKETKGRERCVTHGIPLTFIMDEIERPP